ncbi:MAG: hypothetical protein OJF47_001051 [Nitrospira sp.]|nr:MAG: hypothetical protein OJF47_001051 [Nitrospira sp.]
MVVVLTFGGAFYAVLLKRKNPNDNVPNPEDNRLFHLPNQEAMFS